MSGLIKGLTWFMLPLPPLFLVLAAISPIWPVHAAIAMFLLIIYSSIWLFFRPQSFVIAPGEFTIRFPARHKTTPCSAITAIRRLGRDEFKTELGRAYRVGAGGLWGGFGWLTTSRRGWVEFYISRQDDYVLIERGRSAPLLITPDEPKRFVEALERVC